MKKFFNDAIIKTKEFIEGNDLIDSSIFVKTNLLKTVTFVKDMHQFDKLLNIKFCDNKLIYLLYSSENDEEINIITKVFDKKVHSLATLFDNAVDLELNIYKNYGISFLN